jgi:hypothetical protein
MSDAPPAPKGATPALLALLHPWSLLALVILGVNDHLWKGVGPGWLTGKLSDVAGLFYFPFLVLLLLGCILPGRYQGSLRRFAPAVFVGVGLWFAAAKTIPIVHGATVGLAEFFLGEVQVVMDPSDAIALLSLLPAWLLYRRVSKAPPKAVSRVWKPAALGVAVLLTAATSRPWSQSVDKLIVHEGQLYAYVDDYYETYEGDDRYNDVYTSRDGVSWTRAEALPLEVVKDHRRQHSASWKGDSLTASGTAVWSTQGTHSFHISEARQKFMRASGARPYQVSDMALLPNDADTLVVALETEGVAVLDKSGRWTRYAVGDAIPTPTEMSSSETLSHTGLALLIFGASATLICWILVSLLVWRSQQVGVPPSAKLKSRDLNLGKKIGLFLRNAMESYGKAIRGEGNLLRAGGCILVPAFMYWGQLYPDRITGGEIPVFPILSVPFLGLSLIMIAINWNDFNERYKRKPKKTYFLASLPVGALAMGSIVLWYMGYLESVTSAVLLSAMVILAQVTIIAGRLPRQ